MGTASIARIAESIGKILLALKCSPFVAATLSEGYRWCVAFAGERMAGISWLRIASVGLAGNLRGVERHCDLPAPICVALIVPHAA